MLRTHTCGQLRKEDIGKEVELSGWVYRRRDHGGVIFIDLRDRYGVTQIKFDVDHGTRAEIMKEADQLRSEWVINVKGKVAARPADMLNAKLATGEVEVEIVELNILNKSNALPFEIEEEKESEANEQIRLKYRFLDLRREKLQNIMKKRDEVIAAIREYFHKESFVDIQTPILANSSPEGARDYLVPSRLHPGKFYALPQAPQQFKQLLMVAGFDRYFQVAPCFRDEDPRSDRHPGDFYQIDFEMSFIKQEDIWAITEPLMIELTEKFTDKQIVSKPFPRIAYHDALTIYGSDKPDLRFDLKIKPITEMITADCGFTVFANAIKDGGVVHALKVDGGNEFSRSVIDDLTELAKSKEAKGLAYIQMRPEGPASPINKFLGDELMNKIIAEVGAITGDIIFFGADKFRTVCSALGAVRSKCGELLGLKDPQKISFAWIVDFPMFSMSEIEPGKVDFEHNPFSMPSGGLETLEKEQPLNIKANQYDMACNGYEILSGAIRNHDPKIMYKAFEIAGYTREEVDKKFGAMIRAFEFGAPPHGGAAIGFDRLLMILLDCDSIRDIYAFPKDGAGRDVMMDSPSEVNPKQLKELHIKIDEK
ncbi:MAG TPA: aspartate--tRNA ligase [Candidatus Methylomirabilis sp.]|nr:aspartate--tRNA ligase [Candidatus Methylomirabilis sp.]